MLFRDYYKNIFKEDLNKFFSTVTEEEKINTINPIEIFIGRFFPNGITHYVNNTFFKHLNFLPTTPSFGFQYIFNFESNITVKSYKFTKSQIYTYSKMHFKNNIDRSYFLISLCYIITLDQFFHYKFSWEYNQFSTPIYNKFRILTNYPKYIVYHTIDPKIFNYNKYSHENPNTLIYDDDFMNLPKTALAEIGKIFKDEFFEFINNWELNYRALNMPEEFFGLHDYPIVQNDIDAKNLWGLFTPYLPKGIAK